MLFKKDNRRIRIMTVGASMLALLFISGCKKLKTNDPFIYSITATMPHDGTPVPNAKFRIVEYKYKTRFGKNVGDAEPTGWEINGATDSQGKASGEFMGEKKTNYYYQIFFDYSAIVLPSGITDVSIKGPQFDQLSRSGLSENTYNIIVLPYTSSHFKVENVNCLDANDKMRFKVFNYDEQPNQAFQYMPWGPYFDGCGLHVDYNSDHTLAGHQVFQIEVVRNGVLDTTYIDTFNLLPNTVNEIFLQY
jgi:hypothetical protein